MNDRSRNFLALTGLIILAPSVLIPVAFLALVILAPWIKLALWIWQ